MLADPAFPWDEDFKVITRSAGSFIVPRRAVLFHSQLHAIRHYAQLATLMRHAGFPPTWHMDYLMMAARPL
jgi:uncharacterized damage-inducible protein DinB